MSTASQSESVKKQRTLRPYPMDSLQSSLVIAQAIKSESAGQPMAILDLAQAIGRTPSSSALRSLITSSSKYGLTVGGYQGPLISLTPRGLAIVSPRDENESAKAIIDAAMEPTPFNVFLSKYDQNKFPQDQIAINVLIRDLDLPADIAEECLGLIKSNSNFAGFLRDISGSVYIDTRGGNTSSTSPVADEPGVEEPLAVDSLQFESGVELVPPVEESRPEKPENRRIFIGHGKNTVPVDQLEKVLTRFKIPFVRAVIEPNRGRPISQKVEDTMRSCNASILVFTADEEFLDTEGNTVWRPSENVVHELGAASVLHGERIVIFKEEKVNFPSNFKDIGHISFETDRLDAKGVELVSELISFGLLSVSVG